MNEFHQRLSNLSPTKRELFAALDPGSDPRGGPADDVSGAEEQISGILAEVLGLPGQRARIAAGTSLFELGGGEPEAARVLQLVRERLGVGLDVRDLYRAKVLATAVGLAAPPATDHSSLVPIRTDGRGTPLFCVHGASGSAYPFAALGRLLPAGQPVYGLEAAGLEDDRASADSIEELAAGYAGLVRAVVGQQPCLLLGWSLGGLIAFELARQLIGTGGQVERLIVVDAPPPIGRDAPSESEIIARFMDDLSGETGRPYPGLPGPASPAPAADQDWFADLIHQGNGSVPAGVDAEQLRRRYAVFRANARAAVGYRPQWSFPGRLALIRAEQSTMLRSTWSGFAEAVDEYEVAGAHYSIWGAEHLPALCRIIMGLAGDATSTVA